MTKKKSIMVLTSDHPRGLHHLHEEDHKVRVAAWLFPGDQLQHSLQPVGRACLYYVITRVTEIASLKLENLALKTFRFSPASLWAPHSCLSATYKQFQLKPFPYKIPPLASKSRATTLPTRLGSTAINQFAEVSYSANEYFCIQKWKFHFFKVYYENEGLIKIIPCPDF